MPHPPSRIATALVRVSTDQQADSADLQSRTVIDYAAARQLHLPPSLLFVDEDVSGKTPIADRKGGGAMLQALEHGWCPDDHSPPTPVRHVIFTKIDRMGRNVADMIQFWDHCTREGVTIHILDLGGDTITNQGPMGKVVFAVMAALAEMFRVNLQDAVQKRIDDKFTRGGITGTIPYGWMATTPEGAPATMLPAGQYKNGKPKLQWPRTTRLAPNPETARHVREMHRMRQGGLSYNHIAKALRDAGTPTQTGGPEAWNAGTTRRILTSKHTQKLLSLT